MLSWLLSSLGRSFAASAATAPAEGGTLFRCDKRELNVRTGTFETTSIYSTPDRDEAVEACRVETVRGLGQGHFKFFSVSPSGQVQLDADPGEDPAYRRVVIDRLNFELSAESSYLQMWSEDQLVGVVAFHDNFRPSLGLNAPGLSWTWSCGALELLNYIHESNYAVAIYVKNGHVDYARKVPDKILMWPGRRNLTERHFTRGSSAALDMLFENQCAGTLRDFSRTWF